MLLINKVSSRKGCRKCSGTPSRQLTTHELALSVYSFESTAWWVQSREFLCTLYAASKSTDSVTCSINFSITSVQKYVNSMRSLWNSTAIKRMRKRLKPGSFSSFSSLGLGTRLVTAYIFAVTSDHTSKSLLTQWPQHVNKILLSALHCDPYDPHERAFMGLWPHQKSSVTTMWPQLELLIQVTILDSGIGWSHWHWEALWTQPLLCLSQYHSQLRLPLTPA